MKRSESTCRSILRGMAAVAVAVLCSLLMVSAFATPVSARSKYHAVPLERMLSVRTHTVDISGSLFRYARFATMTPFTYRTQRIFGFNRTSCKSFLFSGAQETDGAWQSEGDARPEVIVLAEGLGPQVWTVPHDSVGVSPRFKVKPGRGAIVKVRRTIRNGGSDVYLNGFGVCKTRTGKK